MKRAVILAAYVAIALADAALGQPKEPPTYYPIPPSMQKAFATSDPVLDQLAALTAASLGAGAALIAPPSNTPLPLQAPIVISFGRGGLVDEHRKTFAGYQRHKVKVEIRGPCYSACTLVLAFVEPENLCVAAGGFMAFHAIRSGEHGEIMPGATARWMYWEQPLPIRQWIDRNGGWEKLPLNGYWTMYDRDLWAFGYPRCK